MSQTHVIWKYEKSLPDVPSVLVYRNVMYMVRNGGILQMLDPGDGVDEEAGAAAECAGGVLCVAGGGGWEGLLHQPDGERDGVGGGGELGRAVIGDV